VREHCNSMNKKQEGCDDGTPIVVGLLACCLLGLVSDEKKKVTRLLCRM